MENERLRRRYINGKYVSGPPIQKREICIGEIGIGVHVFRSRSRPELRCQAQSVLERSGDTVLRRVK